MKWQTLTAGVAALATIVSAQVGLPLVESVSHMLPGTFSEQSADLVTEQTPPRTSSIRVAEERRGSAKHCIRNAWPQSRDLH